MPEQFYSRKRFIFRAGPTSRATRQASHWAAALALSVSALRYCFSRSHEHWSRGSQMPGDLGFSDRVVGLGAGIFFSVTSCWKSRVH